MEPLQALSHGQTFIGAIAVQYFFVISGFLITMSWEKSRGILDYLHKRASRIYPGFLVAFLMSVCVFGALGASDPRLYLHSLHPARLLSDMLRLHPVPALPTFLQNPSPRHLNGSLWSIAIEFECYLLVMALGMAGLLRQRGLMALGFVLCWGATIGLTYRLPGLTPLANHLPELITDKVALITAFMAGMLLYLYRERVLFSPKTLVGCLVLWGASLFSTGFNALLPICGSYVLFYLAFSPSLKFQNWSRRMDLSYGLYLYGWPVQQLIVQSLGTHATPWLVATISIPVTGLLAVASWFCVEKPFLKRKNRIDPDRGAVGIDSVDAHTEIQPQEPQVFVV